MRAHGPGFFIKKPELNIVEHGGTIVEKTTGKKLEACGL